MEAANGTVKTSDLGLATFLYSLGAELSYIDRADPRQAVFVFQVTPEAKEKVCEWQAGMAEVNAAHFWRSYQSVKLALYKSH